MRSRLRSFLRVAAALAALATAQPAGAIVMYEASAGFRQNGFYILKQQSEPQEVLVTEFSYGGALCPAAGTPNYLCGRVHSQAGLAGGGRLFLKSEARLTRTNAQGPNHEYAAYADTTITIPSLGSNSATTGAGAYFVFGMHGIVSKRTTNAAVTVQAFASAVLSTSTNVSIQCVDEACSAPIPVLLENYKPTDGFRLNLRSDVAIVALTAPQGYDAEVVADFGDTLELLAIQVVDENHQPIPGVSLFVPDQTGQPLFTIPATPPETTTTIVGGSTTTTTLVGTGGQPIAGKLLTIRDPVKAKKRAAVFVGRDPGIVVEGIDPRVGGATVDLTSAVTSDRWSLPATGWTRKKGTFRYTDRTGRNGPVVAASIADRSVIVKAKGAQIRFGLRGAAGQGTVAVRLATPAPSAKAFCAAFPGAQGTVQKDDAAKGVFRAVRAEPPPTCMLP